MRSAATRCRHLLPLTLAGVGLLLAGCETTGSTRLAEEPRRGTPAPGASFNRIQLSAAAVAFRYWDENARDEAFTYEIDRYDRRVPARFRARLEEALPRPETAEATQHRTFAFERIEFPEQAWALVTYREGNKYHSIEYTDVLRWESDGWRHIDHFLVAEGLMDPVMLDFKWSTYRELYIEGNAATDAALPVETPAP